MILTTDVILKSHFASILFANILSCFANVLIHFPNFYHLINGLNKQEVYKCVSTFFVMAATVRYILRVLIKNSSNSQRLWIFSWRILCSQWRILQSLMPNEHPIYLHSARFVS